jgi:hypothetical protein
MFAKSRMTISTIVRPENIKWYKQLGESGVRPGAKRYKRSEHSDFERRVYEAIGKGQAATTKAEIARVAEAIARSQNLPNFGESLHCTHGCSHRAIEKGSAITRATVCRVHTEVSRGAVSTLHEPSLQELTTGSAQTGSGDKQVVHSLCAAARHPDYKGGQHEASSGGGMGRMGAG